MNIKSTEFLLTASLAAVSLKAMAVEHGHEDLFGPIPSDLTRHLTCPNVENSTPVAKINGKEYRYKSSEEVNYNTTGWENRTASNWEALSNLNLGDMEVVVIDIRRIGGKPHYLYLSNGKQHKLREPWSSSKFMAAASAASRARKQSGGMVGLNASSGIYNLGDMVTAMHSYLPAGNVPGNSNAMAMYFLTRAGREYSTSLLHDAWLKISDKSVFKGGYGENPFSTGSNAWQNSKKTLVSMPEINEPYEIKDMSALAQAEFLKRITQHITDPTTAMPFVQRADISTLLYGSQNRPNEIGGMLKGDTTYMAEALMGGMPLGRYNGGFGGPENEPARKHFDAVTKNQWRIFQKSGLGVSASRNMSEVTMASYACLPGFDGGREFLIVTSAHVPGQNGISTADKMTTNAFNKIVPLLVPGFAPHKESLKKDK